MKLVRKILFPIVPIYYAVTWLRNKAYDEGIFNSKSYELPLITVGNLSVGGTGKSPMIEYLIKILQDHYKIATLSRGYKRNTTGFILANEKSSALSLGDEPFQFYQKFKDVIVSVDANRQNGIAELENLAEPPEVILLDDAFQHRKVNANFNILLTTYSKLYVDDFVLPTGDLREPKIGAKRANIIIVTKCPPTISIQEQETIIKKIKPLSHQDVFFSSIKYSDKVYSLDSDISLSKLKVNEFTLVTGIANPKPLIDFLNSEGFSFEHLRFKDHHEFSVNEISILKSKSFILTTEKDFMRLKDKMNSDILYYLPIETKMFQEEEFNKCIKDYVISKTSKTLG
ncbi:tetraacyldisaccharide 4'-kinase [Flavobacteriaceae bacterium AU392]|nr:tetraacyldisaccharide 4'-kinase [Flavobacteriaceae bacterium]RKM82896.1 tetraacyldisaccharide 4'-kinase [Flavobacteriaceae bacterium AU392]